MIKGLWYAAKRGTLEEFLDLYEDSSADPSELLIPSLTQKVPDRRVKIANHLLDEGADASVVEGSDKVNAIHVLFGHRWRNHDVDIEAGLLSRLVAAGADINGRSPRFGLPLEALFAIAASDDELKPFYDVIFDLPGINMDLVINAHSNSTLKDLLFNASGGRSKLAERARDYYQAQQCSEG